MTEPYVYPLAGANVVPERIDQGQDFGGVGPVAAIGKGRIVNVYNSGWPGGTFIVEHLTDGPYAGGYWYTAEDVTPQVYTGQLVDAGQIIGQLHGQTEMGFAAPPPAIGESLAHYRGHYTFPTPEGTQAGSLLKSTAGGTAVTTSFPGGGILSGPGGGVIGEILGSGGGWTDKLERLGLILLGAAMVLIGIWMLAGKQVTKVAVTAVAPEATAAGAVAGKAREGQ